MKNTSRKFAAILAFAALAASVGCGSKAGVTTAADMGAQEAQTPTFANAAAAKAAFDASFTADGVSKKKVNILFKGAMNSSATILSKHNLKQTNAVKQINMIEVEVPAGMTAEQMAEKLMKEVPGIVAQPSRKVMKEATVRSDKDINDPMAKDQYSLNKLQARAGWDITMGKADVKIAVIDTGVDLNHPDLKDKIVPGFDATNPGGQPMDDDGHGTHVAGIAAAAADNGVGIAGVAPNVKILPVKVLSNGGGSSADIAKGIVWAADNGADVGTMSLGLYNSDAAIEKALQYALDKGVVLTASSGNRGGEYAVHLPSTHPGVIEVGASDSSDKRASFSNYGKKLSVMAPGVDILSTLPTYDTGSGEGKNYGKLSGTSMAAPHAAGLAALIRSQHPKLAPAEVKKIMEKSADKLGEGNSFDRFTGFGRINLPNAVKL